MEQEYQEQRAYYRSVFPVQTLCNWLTQCQHESSDPYDDAGLLARREFSFILPGDIYCRYKSFGSWRELQEALVKECPEKVDAGAIWQDSSMRKSAGAPDNKPVEREFVIDIDMTDYDHIRTCCQGATICHMCWKFMIVAVKSLEIAMKESFGFQKLLYVFSGRRGIHCWVCDYQARIMDDLSRKQLIKFLKRKARVTPFVQIAEQVLYPMFEEIMVQDQHIFDSPDQRSKFVSTYNVQPSSQQTGSEWWAEILANLKPQQKLEVHLDYLFPKIDEAVSCDSGHLLKVPFSIHPKTGNVCVPLLPEMVDTFDPTTVPTLLDTARDPDCIQNYVEILSQFADSLQEEKTKFRHQQIRLKREEVERSTDF